MSQELLRVRREDAEGTLIVHVAGEVDLATVSTLSDELSAVAPPFVLDLTEVTFLGSAGLDVLVRQDKRAKAAGVGLRVVTGNRAVARTITLTGLDDVLTVLATLSDLG